MAEGAPVGGSSPFILPCTGCFYAEDSLSAGHESYFLRGVGSQGVGSFFCKSVSTLIAVDAFMTREPTQQYIPTAFL